MIPEAQIGFLIAPESTQSVLTVGGYNTDYIQSGSSLTWFDLVGTMWWEVSMATFTYGGSSYLPSGATAIVDSGTSFLAMPASTYDDVVNSLKSSNSDLVYADYSYYFNTDCNSVDFSNA